MRLTQEDFEENLFYRLDRNYGLYLPISFDQLGEPKLLWGPQYYIFLSTFAGSLTLLVYLDFILISAAHYNPYVACGLVMVVLNYAWRFVIIGLSQPGIASHAAEPTVAAKSHSRYCVPCKIVRGSGTHHCYSCDVCILELDHHCPWVGKCIGKQNLSQFHDFLRSIVLAFAAHIATLYFISP